MMHLVLAVPLPLLMLMHLTLHLLLPVWQICELKLGIIKCLQSLLHISTHILVGNALIKLKLNLDGDVSITLGKFTVGTIDAPATPATTKDTFVAGAITNDNAS